MPAGRSHNWLNHSLDAEGSDSGWKVVMIEHRPQAKTDQNPLKFRELLLSPLVTVGRGDSKCVSVRYSVVFVGATQCSVAHVRALRSRPLAAVSAARHSGSR